MISQGVDTVLFPRDLLHLHATSSRDNILLFSHKQLLMVADFYHHMCPESFFQDDYIISALLFATQIPIKSIWNGNKVALHVDDVSTSYQQMHLSIDVYLREQATKQCVESTMQTVVDMMSNASEKEAASQQPIHNS
jgi:hypothetical protein